jgi:hypothetical protein
VAGLYSLQVRKAKVLKTVGLMILQLNTGKPLAESLNGAAN